MCSRLFSRKHGFQKCLNTPVYLMCFFIFFSIEQKRTEMLFFLSKIKSFILFFDHRIVFRTLPVQFLYSFQQTFRRTPSSFSSDKLKMCVYFIRFFCLIFPYFNFFFWSIFSPSVIRFHDRS